MRKLRKRKLSSLHNIKYNINRKTGFWLMTKKNDGQYGMYRKITDEDFSYILRHFHDRLFLSLPSQKITK